MMWRRNSTALWCDEAPNKRVACSVLRCHVSVLLRDAAVLFLDAAVLLRDAGVLLRDAGVLLRDAAVLRSIAPPECGLLPGPGLRPCAAVLCCGLSRRLSVDCCRDLGYDLVPPCCVAVYRAA